MKIKIKERNGQQFYTILLGGRLEFNNVREFVDYYRIHEMHNTSGTMNVKLLHPIKELPNGIKGKVPKLSMVSDIVKER